MKKGKFESIKQIAESRLNPVTVEIEKRMIKRYAEAVGDMNQLWVGVNNDIEYGCGSVIAPPLLMCTPMMLGMPVLPDLPGYYERGLFGGWSLKLFQDIRPGDVITAITRVADIRERKGKLGNLLLIDYETEHYREKSELVAYSKGTIIHY